MKTKAAPFLLGLALSVLGLLWFASTTVNSRGPLSLKIARGEALITLLEGSASIQSGQNSWRPLRSGNSLRGGDEVQVEKGSRLEIRLPDQSSLRFAEDTRFKIVSVDMSNEANTRNARVNVALGKAWANISKTAGGSKPNIEMSSRNAVCGVRGTVYRMNVEPDASVLVRVYDGEVKVSGGEKSAKPGLGGPPRKVAGPTVIEGPHPVSMEDWTYIVKSMQQIKVGQDGIAQKPESFTEAQDRDEWVEWNRIMDSRGPDEKTGSGETGWFNWFRN